MPKKKTPFFYFMIEYKKREEAKGRKFHNLHAVIPFAGQIWEKMSVEQRQPYFEMARTTNAEGKPQGALNSLGIPISEIDARLRAKENKTKMIKNLIAERVKYAESRHELEKEVFYVISMAYFGRTLEGAYLPAELGVIKYSLQDGVMDRMHMYINPCEIPLGAALSMISHTDKTHQLPIPPNAWGETDRNEIVKQLFNFLAVEDEIPPLFTDEDLLPIVESMLSDYMEDKKLYVCPLPELLCNLKQATERHFMGQSTFPSPLMAQYILQIDCYAFALGICCDYHEEKLNFLHCALSQATRWAYIISKYCCLNMGIACIPGKHIPALGKSTLSDLYDYEAELKPSTSGTNLLLKQEKSNDLCTVAKSATQKPIEKSFNETEKPSTSTDKPPVSQSTNDVKLEQSSDTQTIFQNFIKKMVEQMETISAEPTDEPSYELHAGDVTPNVDSKLTTGELPVPEQRKSGRGRGNPFMERTTQGRGKNP